MDGCGRRWARRPAVPTCVDARGRRLGIYGSGGWCFEFLRACCTNLRDCGGLCYLVPRSIPSGLSLDAVGSRRITDPALALPDCAFGSSPPEPGGGVRGSLKVSACLERGNGAVNAPMATRAAAASCRTHVIGAVRCEAEAVGEGTMLDCLHGGRPDHEDSMGRFRLACGRVDICGDGSVEQTGTVPGASPPGADPTRVPATSNELLGPRTSQNTFPDRCYTRVLACSLDTESSARRQTEGRHAQKRHSGRPGCWHLRC